MADRRTFKVYVVVYDNDDGSGILGGQVFATREEAKQFLRAEGFVGPEPIRLYGFPSRALTAEEEAQLARTSYVPSLDFSWERARIQELDVPPIREE